jgi:predicted Holliday junction resolvase-like endonuclease
MSIVDVISILVGFSIALIIFIILYYFLRIKLIEINSELKRYKEHTHLLAENRAAELLNVKIEATLKAYRADWDQKKIDEIKQLQSNWEYQKQIDIQRLIVQIRKETSDRSRATLKGQISEQLAPLLEEFYEKYELSDARFIGDPIDYIIFENLTKLKDEIKNKVPTEQRSEIIVTLADIKTGKSQLNTEQRKIRDAVAAGRVKWDLITINVPEQELQDNNIVIIPDGKIDATINFICNCNYPNPFSVMDIYPICSSPELNKTSIEIGKCKACGVQLYLPNGFKLLWNCTKCGKSFDTIEQYKTHITNCVSSLTALDS